MPKPVDKSPRYEERIELTFGLEDHDWWCGGHWDYEREPPMRKDEYGLIPDNTAPTLAPRDGDLERYDPKPKVKKIYAAFAALGRLAWSQYEGKLADPKGEGWKKNQLGEVREPLLSFTVKYGPLVSPMGGPHHLKNSLELPLLWRTAQAWLRQAQLVWLVAETRRVMRHEVAGEEDLAELVEGVARSEDWDMIIPSKLARDRSAVLATSSEVLSIVCEWPRKLPPSHRWYWAKKGEEIYWHTRPVYRHLIELIWSHAMGSLSTGAALRECANANCKLPGRLFEPRRTDMLHHSKDCQNARSSRAHYSGHGRKDRRKGEPHDDK
jgi:hypothetical protein